MDRGLARDLAGQFVDHFDGESGAHLLTAGAVALSECAGPGAADSAVAFWLKQPSTVFHADDPTLRASLKGYGAWDDLTTVDLDTIKARVLWLAANDWRESQTQIARAQTRAERLIELGFDLSEAVIDDPGTVRLKCSQCAAMRINGVAIHENRCPNETFECRECEGGRVSRKGAICEGCQTADTEWDHETEDESEDE